MRRRSSHEALTTHRSAAGHLLFLDVDAYRLGTYFHRHRSRREVIFDLKRHANMRLTETISSPATVGPSAPTDVAPTAQQEAINEAVFAG